MGAVLGGCTASATSPSPRPDNDKPPKSRRRRRQDRSSSRVNVSTQNIHPGGCDAESPHRSEQPAGGLDAAQARGIHPTKELHLALPHDSSTTVAATDSSHHSSRACSASFNLERAPRIVFCGVSGAGKTTYLRQLRNICVDPPSLAECVALVRGQLFVLLHELHAGMHLLGIELSMEVSEAYDIFKVASFNQIEFSRAAILRLLNESDGLVLAMPRGDDFNFPKTGPYFIKNAARILEDDFSPTMDDILHTYVPTCGSATHSLHLRGDIGPDVDVIDLGGTLTERRKWARVLASRPAAVVCFVSSVAFHSCVEEGGMSKLEASLGVLSQLTTVGQSIPVHIVLTHEDKMAAVDASPTDIDALEKVIARCFVQIRGGDPADAPKVKEQGGALQLLRHCCRHALEMKDSSFVALNATDGDAVVKSFQEILKTIKTP